MRKEDFEWYKKEFEKYPFKHQTIDNKGTFLCLTNLKKGEVLNLDTRLYGEFVFCPGCGEKLGKCTEVEDGHKAIWKDQNSKR